LFAQTSKAKLLKSYFLKHLQVLKLDLKFVIVKKIKFKYLKVGETFLQVFFQAFQYWCGEHSHISFWLMKFVFITKIIPNPLKNDIIVGDTFEVFFQVQMI
jgi:hypothetical protein